MENARVIARSLAVEVEASVPWAAAQSCKECGGASLCTMVSGADQCKECGGASICPHGRQRSSARSVEVPASVTMGGSAVRARSLAGGASICPSMRA